MCHRPSCLMPENFHFRWHNDCYMFGLFWCPFMQSAQLCVAFSFFCLLFSSFLLARFPFQRTISANWWTVGSRVRPNQSKPPFSSYRSPLSFLQNPLLSYFVSYMDSPTPISVKSLQIISSRSSESVLCLIWVSVFLVFWKQNKTKKSNSWNSNYD